MNVSNITSRQLFFLVIGVVLCDRIITIPFWHLEGNISVIHMGKSVWLMLTAFLLLLYVYTYQILKETAFEWVFRGASMLLAAWHFVIITLNIFTILYVLA